MPTELESLQRRFEVLNENLQIRQEQFDHAMKMLESERLAHVAEVERLRAALEVMQAYLTGPAEFESKAPELYALWLNEQEELNSIWHLRLYIESALAAEHGPLVAAVEQMATVLGERHAETCQSILLDCDCKLGHRQRAALAAYRAAMGGNDEPR